MASRRPAKQNSFSPEKAIAAVGYLAENTGESMYPLMKMMYLADRLHLWRYGRLIAGDTYSAMKEGPVPSVTYDLLKHVRGEQKNVPGVALAERTFAYGPNHKVSLKMAPDYGELSASDVECLAEVVNLLKKHGSVSIRDMSHDTAWEKSRAGLSKFLRACNMSIEDIAAQSDDGADLLEYLRDPQPGSA